jgi:predicted Fe-Mo cluster-binding NifX family protein
MTGLKVTKMTKIAIPSMSIEGLESEVCAHFGSCEYFTIVDVRDGSVAEVKAVDNGSHEGEHNCAAPAVLLKSHGIDAVLVSGIGGRPLMALTQNKIKVFAGAVGRVSDAVKDYNDGLLQELSTRGTCNCSHH